MLEFSKSQMSTMAHEFDAGLKGSIERLLREDFPDLTDDPQALSAFATVAIEDARFLGIRSGQGIAAYAVAAFLLGLEVKNDRRLVEAMLAGCRTQEEKTRWLEQWIITIARELEA